MNQFPASVRVFLAIIVCGLCGCSASEREFTVVAYNVENLFDVDGIAIYKDYTQDEPDDPFTYGRLKLLTKLQNTAAVLKTVNAGAGPEVILFQELEADFTPESGVADLNVFLEQHRETTVEQMLTTGWQPEYAGLPAQAWLLKVLSDAGLVDYSVVVAPAKAQDVGIAHTNAVFSRFPIQEVQLHELEQARDIFEVTLDVEGHPLTVYVNHWKSGASSPTREPIRAQNATVLRGLVDARLAADPMADIIIGGDLNSHYNHSILYPDVTTGINDVLGSQGDELAIRELGGVDLYNLWFELPPEQRYSEVWKGNRGTLMHLLITRGLYDQSGVRYVDGSFEVLMVPGLNADPLGRPLEWNFAGETGGGVTDHFPVAARFSVGSGVAGEFVELETPSAGDDALDFEMPLGYLPTMDLQLDDGAFLVDVADAELGPYVGHLYQVNAMVLKLRPMTIDVGGDQWAAYAPDKAVYAQLKEIKGAEAPSAMVVKLGIWKGKRQFVVEGLK
ncbi:MULTISPECIES: endonuclease/exonuclease/phosphatase family protein [unclassified Lentimonas]|uniref:endonuclease/exonuclease/phosphatase family protein n=1 Tax=unclassified Lentimonas TaxID=2630993 RepID=UPI001321EB50|nr:MULTISPECIES: endonuclease/exonuclease/phosphatase family protein [unclassified Lentimonas]CAA6677216.1 Unannotated [Lentimonas sp. CC4]CAA6686159.1 Unannotated [Lentimonas sp. CC6]CAA7074191.1 Unannotated [Lentimonas sp. CC4]CAA7171549.1 Unannotated [Lentimonas sp. CC21]CAA7182029.1 Unannotated [Lentimonas sp. CC8]